MKKMIYRILIFLGLTLFSLAGFSADHSEAPGSSADPAADIADFYAWHQAGKLTTVTTFGGLKVPEPGQTGLYDDRVRYIVNIDNDGDSVADIKATAHFFKKDGNWKIQVSDLPGSTGPVWGDVESLIGNGGNKIYAGLRDDPFFFDFQGFQDTLATATISFDNTRDSFAGTNVTAIVLQMDLADSLQGQTGPLKIWATTERGK